MAAAGKGRTKAIEAYRSLKRKLHDGDFQAGERLTEARVAEMLGVGRLPAREALLKLESEGMLSGRGAYGGKFVRYMEDENPEDVIHRYELREVVEGLAARLASKNLTGWQIDELRDVEQKVAAGFDTGDRAARTQASGAFHQYLVSRCGNPLLSEVWEKFDLSPRTVRFPELEAKIWAHFDESVERTQELKPIVEAIANHDPDMAEEAARAHVRRITHAIRKTLWEKNEEPAE